MPIAGRGTKRLKIVDVAEFYAPQGGGVRTYCHQKLRAGGRLGHEVVILAPGPENRTEEREGGRIVYLEAPALPVDRRYHLFWSAEPVHRFLDAEQPDVVEASSPWRGAQIVASWKGEAPKALVMHADPVASHPQQWFAGLIARERVDDLFAWFWRYLARLSARFERTVTGSGWMTDRLLANGLAMPLTVPMGVDTMLFHPGRRDPALRRRLLADLGLGEEAMLLIGLGRQHSEKRWPLMIEAVARANEVRPVGLLLLGDGPHRAAVMRAVGRTRHVAAPGALADRDSVAAMVASADALIHGGWSETFGMAAAEALSAGTPIIVPDLGGCSALAGPAHAETFAADDLKSAASAILRMAGRDRRAAGFAAIAAGRRLVGPAERHFARLFDAYAMLAAGRIGTPADADLEAALETAAAA